MDIAKFQAYGYFFLVAILAIGLYMYIYHIYSSQKKGIRDYEKYSDIALNDEVTDKPVEQVSKDETENKEHK